MPKIEWTKDNMAYSMCAFPFIGAAIGFALYCWAALSAWLNFSAVLFAAGITLLPAIITGGIHLDGFCDTADALASHADREKKLEILKDANIGAFAAIVLAVYFLLYFCFAYELKVDKDILLMLCLGHILSRCLSGYGVAALPCAKNSGLLYTFADAAIKNKVRIILSVMILLVCAALICINIFYGVIICTAALLCFLYYSQMSKRQFGGITGDLAGYFLQLCELGILAAAVIAQKIFNIIS